MKKRSCLEINLDEQGHLILPPELLAEYGITQGSKVRLEENPVGFRISRSSHNLARVYIEPTNMCNLTCATCMRNSWNEPPGRMEWSTFKKIITNIEMLSAKPSIFFGGFGEPLTHPDILEMAAAAKKVGSSVEMITNGILLTPEVIRRFIEIKMDRLWVSLDGATPQNYADVRLGDELPWVLNNLKTLRGLIKDSEFKLPKLGIAFVAMKRNINDLPKVLDLGKRFGADMFSVSNVLPYTKEMQDQALYAIPTYGNTTASRWAPELLLPRMNLNEMTQGPFIQAMNKSGPITIARQDIGMGADTCPFVEKGSLSIRWDGAVSPCQALMHENENYLDFRKRKTLTYSIGNINDNSMLEIWNNPEYIAFRERVIGFDFSFCTNCNSCYMAESNEEDCFGSPMPTCGGCLWGQGLIQCP